MRKGASESKAKAQMQLLDLGRDICMSCVRIEVTGNWVVRREKTVAKVGFANLGSETGSPMVG